jgi:hypothetical protein
MTRSVSQSCRKTSSNRILERFFKSHDPRKGPSVLYFPFRERTPISIKKDQNTMSTVHPEYGHYPEGTIPEALFDKATREIANYLVSFSIEDRPSGSATLVTMDSRYGFLTAAHVVNDLYESRSESIAIIFCDRLHRLPIRKDHLAATRIGPTNEGSGPDLAFLEVLDTKALGAIKAVKSFYPFTNPTAPQWETFEPKGGAICFIAGAPAEQSSETGTRMTESHILFTTLFCGRAQLSQIYAKDGFEYMVFGSVAGEDGFPQSFRGISGGGIWHVPFAIDPEKGPSSLTHLRSELIGIAFCQDELCENTRQITVHGYKSAYNELHRRLMQG